MTKADHKCPECGADDWDLIAHSSIPPVVGTILDCAKCGYTWKSLVKVKDV